MDSWPTSGGVVDALAVVNHGSTWTPASSVRFYLPAPAAVVVEAAALVDGRAGVAVAVDGELRPESIQRDESGLTWCYAFNRPPQRCAFTLSVGWHEVSLWVLGKCRVRDRSVSWSVPWWP